jgi:hypothetical protein
MGGESGPDLTRAPLVAEDVRGDKIGPAAGRSGVGNSPVTCELDGRQFALLGGGGALYAWALRESKVE